MQNFVTYEIRLINPMKNNSGICLEWRSRIQGNPVSLMILNRKKWDTVQNLMEEITKMKQVDERKDKN